MPVTTVFLVEDDESVAANLCRRLTGLGYQVAGTSSSASGAVSGAAEFRPDLMLLDLALNDGSDCLLTASEIRQRFNIPTVYVTAVAYAGLPEPFGYLLRPFTDADLRASIEMALYTHTMEEKLQALQAYAKELQARNEELDAFAHTVAHDLKNPLAILLGNVDVLETFYEVTTEAERLGYFRAVRVAGQKLDNIVEELLLLAVVRKTDVELLPLDMDQVVSEALMRLRYMIAESQAEIVLPAAWPPAIGHVPWVEEVWVNYISNAIKYGGHPPRIWLGGDSLPGGQARFWVCDNGAGVHPEVAEVLFAPFTHLAQARARGHGLGLSIVRRIVEKLGGDVALASRPGQGSTFSFTLLQDETHPG